MIYTEILKNPDLLHLLEVYSNYRSYIPLHDNSVVSYQTAWKAQALRMHDLDFIRKKGGFRLFWEFLTPFEPWITSMNTGILPVFRQYLNLSEILLFLPSKYQLKISSNNLLDIARAIQFFETTRYIESFYINSPHSFTDYTFFYVVITPAELLLYDKHLQLITKINFLNSKISYMGLQATEFSNIITFIKNTTFKLVRLIAPALNNDKAHPFWWLRSRKYNRRSFNWLLDPFYNLEKSVQRVSTLAKLKKAYEIKYGSKVLKENSFKFLRVKNPFLVKWGNRETIVRQNTVYNLKPKIQIMKDLKNRVDIIQNANTIHILKEAGFLLNETNKMRKKWFTTLRNPIFNYSNVAMPQRCDYVVSKNKTSAKSFIFSFPGITKLLAQVFDDENYLTFVVGKRETYKETFDFFTKYKWEDVRVANKVNQAARYMVRSSQEYNQNHTPKDTVYLKKILDAIKIRSNLVARFDLDEDEAVDQWYIQERQYHGDILLSAINYYKDSLSKKRLTPFDDYYTKIFDLPNISINEKMILAEEVTNRLSNLFMDNFRKKNVIKSFKYINLLKQARKDLEPFKELQRALGVFAGAPITKFSTKNLLKFQFKNERGDCIKRDYDILDQIKKDYTETLINSYLEVKEVWNRLFVKHFVSNKEGVTYILKPRYKNKFGQGIMKEKGVSFYNQLPEVNLRLTQLFRSLKSDLERRFSSFENEYKLIDNKRNKFWHSNNRTKTDMDFLEFISCRQPTFFRRKGKWSVYRWFKHKAIKYRARYRYGFTFLKHMWLKRPLKGNRVNRNVQRSIYKMNQEIKPVGLVRNKNAYISRLLFNYPKDYSKYATGYLNTHYSMSDTIDSYISIDKSDDRFFTRMFKEFKNASKEEKQYFRENVDDYIWLMAWDWSEGFKVNPMEFVSLLDKSLLKEVFSSKKEIFKEEISLKKIFAMQKWFEIQDQESPLMKTLNSNNYFKQLKGILKEELTENKLEHLNTEFVESKSDFEIEFNDLNINIDSDIKFIYNYDRKIKDLQNKNNQLVNLIRRNENDDSDKLFTFSEEFINDSDSDAEEDSYFSEDFTNHINSYEENSTSTGSENILINSDSILTNSSSISMNSSSSSSLNKYKEVYERKLTNLKREYFLWKDEDFLEMSDVLLRKLLKSFNNDLYDNEYSPSEYQEIFNILLIWKYHNPNKDYDGSPIFYDEDYISIVEEDSEVDSLGGGPSNYKYYKRKILDQAILKSKDSNIEWSNLRAFVNFLKERVLKDRENKKQAAKKLKTFKKVEKQIAIEEKIDNDFYNNFYFDSQKSIESMESILLDSEGLNFINFEDVIKSCDSDDYNSESYDSDDYNSESYDSDDYNSEEFIIRNYYNEEDEFGDYIKQKSDDPEIVNDGVPNNQNHSLHRAKLDLPEGVHRDLLYPFYNPSQLSQKVHYYLSNTFSTISKFSFDDEWSKIHKFENLLDNFSMNSTKVNKLKLLTLLGKKYDKQVLKALFNTNSKYNEKPYLRSDLLQYYSNSKLWSYLFDNQSLDTSKVLSKVTNTIMKDTYNELYSVSNIKYNKVKKDESIKSNFLDHLVNFFKNGNYKNIKRKVLDPVKIEINMKSNLILKIKQKLKLRYQEELQHYYYLKKIYNDTSINKENKYQIISEKLDSFSEIKEEFFESEDSYEKQEEYDKSYWKQEESKESKNFEEKFFKKCIDDDDVDVMLYDIMKKKWMYDFSLINLWRKPISTLKFGKGQLLERSSIKKYLEYSSVLENLNYFPFPKIVAPKILENFRKSLKDRNFKTSDIDFFVKGDYVLLDEENLEFAKTYLKYWTYYAWGKEEENWKEARTKQYYPTKKVAKNFIEGVGTHVVYPQIISFKFDSENEIRYRFTDTSLEWLRRYGRFNEFVYNQYAEFVDSQVRETFDITVDDLSIEDKDLFKIYYIKFLINYKLIGLTKSQTIPGMNYLGLPTRLVFLKLLEKLANFNYLNFYCKDTDMSKKSIPDKKWYKAYVKQYILALLRTYKTSYLEKQTFLTNSVSRKERGFLLAYTGRLWELGQRENEERQSIPGYPEFVGPREKMKEYIAYIVRTLF